MEDLMQYYSEASRLFHNNFYSMGTRLDMVLCGVEREQAVKAYHAVQNRFSELEQKLSYYHKDSMVAMINSNASKEPVALDPEMWQILLECRAYWEMTGGYFDITAGPLVKIISDKNLPEEEKNGYLKASGTDKIRFMEQGRLIRFANGQVRIDLGGYGKGFALQEAKKILNGHEIQNAFISFGESSVLAAGKHPHGDYWQVGIQNIFRPDEHVYVFNISDRSMSTSGNHPGYLSARKLEAGHILDPKKGLLSGNIFTVTATCESPVTAEVLSTSLAAAEGEERREIMKEFPDGHAVLAVYDKAGKVKISKI